MIKKIMLVLAVCISVFFVLFSSSFTGTILGLIAIVLLAIIFNTTSEKDSGSSRQKKT